jgi:hypothetical protein
VGALLAPSRLRDSRQGHPPTQADNPSVGRSSLVLRPFLMPLFTQVVHDPCRATPKP